MKDKKIHINFIYFGFFFIILAIITTINVLYIKSPFKYPKAFFMIYSYGQIVLEIFSLIFLSYFIKKYLSKIILNIFIAFTFILFIIHIVDCIMLNLMDMTMWYGLSIALDETFENFIEMLHLTGLPYFVWMIFGVLALCLPFIGIYIFRKTERVSLKYEKIFLHHDHALTFLFCIPLALLIYDATSSYSINSSIYAAYRKVLPFKTTFMQYNFMNIDTLICLKKPESEDTVFKRINKKITKPVNTPNIYMFIIESLREDFITEEISPNIYKFRKENISFERAISNANCTQKAWFAIFYSKFSFFWKYIQDNYTSGATPLNILKNIGYKLHAYSAAELKYYKMIDVLFGKNAKILDTLELHPHYLPMEAFESDQIVFDKLKNNILESKSNMHIAFLDSTHFLYSWPKKKFTKFKPIIDDISLEYIQNEKIDMNLVKNRYKNSIYYVDMLIGDFINHLKNENIYDDSIIVILGDHGEEFFEGGNLFHASQLSSMQTKIPLYMKLGDNKRKRSDKKMISQIDIFPSILDYVFGNNLFKDIFLGDSIFDKHYWPYVVSARYNASRAPFEFFIHNGEEKLLLRFKNRNDIFKKQHLEIISLKDKDDNLIYNPNKKNLIKPFEKAINQIFEK
ncbi:MAG: hypothetical protein K1060chlam5_00792 [Candidatus Anoxychlamydiales bacterium]|nr:hypothetical protein [Candidatus Anoxychlamydiales bacterium]